MSYEVEGAQHKKCVWPLNPVQRGFALKVVNCQCNCVLDPNSVPDQLLSYRVHIAIKLVHILERGWINKYPCLRPCCVGDRNLRHRRVLSSKDAILHVRLIHWYVLFRSQLCYTCFMIHDQIENEQY